MKKMTKISIVLLFAAIALPVFVTGCINEPVEASIVTRETTINVTVNLNDGSYTTGAMTQGLTAEQWEELPDTAEGMPRGILVIPPHEFDNEGWLRETQLLVQVVADGIPALRYTLSADGSKPIENWSSGNIYNLRHSRYVYIELTLRDEDEELISVTYYRVRIHELDANTILDNLFFTTSLDKYDTGVLPGDSELSWRNLTPPKMKTITLELITETTEVEFEAVQRDLSSRVEYSLFRHRETGNPVFGSNNIFSLDNGDRVFVRVTPYDTTIPPMFYGVIIATSPRLTSVNIGGTTITVTDHGSSSIDDHVPIIVDVTLQSNTNILSATVVNTDDVSVEYTVLLPGSTRLPVFAELDAAGAEIFLRYPGINQIFIKTIVDGMGDRYYRFDVSLRSNITTVTGISISGVPVTSIGTGASGANVGTATGLRGTISLTSAQAAEGSVAVTFEDDTANVVGWAVVASTTTTTAASYTALIPPGKTFNTTAIANGQHLALRVAAADGTLYHHRLAVSVANDNALLTGVTVGGWTTTLGTPSTTMAGITSGEVGVPPSVLDPGNVAFVVTPGDVNATRSYAITTNDFPPAAFTPIPATIPSLTGGNRIWIRSVSQDESVTLYYRILVLRRNDVASIESFTIRGVPAGSIGTGGTAVNVGTGDRGAITINTPTASAGAVLFATPTSGANAVITGYAIADPTNNNPTWTTVTGSSFNAPAAITNGQHVFIRVQAENGINLYYYRIVVTVQSNDATLASVTVGGVSAISIGTPGTTAAGAAAGSVGVPPAALTAGNIAIALARNESGSTQTFAVTTTTTPPTSTVYADITSIPTLAQGNTIWIRSVSHDQTATLFYRILVESKSDAATIESFTIDAVTGTTGTGGTNADVGTTASGAITLTTTAEAAAGAVITAVPTAGSNATVTGYAITTGGVPATWNNVNGGSFTTTAAIANNGHVFVRVVAENGTTTHYYRIAVTVWSDNPALTAATFGGTASSSMGTGRATTAGWTTSADAGEIRLATALAIQTASPAVGSTTANNAVRSYAVTQGTTIPATWSDTATITGGPWFTAANVGNPNEAARYLWVRSVSQDGTATLFYKLELVPIVRRHQTDLVSVRFNFTAGGTTRTNVDLGIPRPAASWDANTPTHLLMSNSTGAPTGVTVTAVARHPDAAIAYGSTDTTGGTALPTTWNTTGSMTSVANNNYLAIRVTAPDGTIAYYRYRVKTGTANQARLQEGIHAAYFGGVPNWANPGGGTIAAAGNSTTTGINTGTLRMSGTGGAANTGRSVVVYATPAANTVQVFIPGTGTTTVAGTAATNTWVPLNRDANDPTRWSVNTTTAGLATASRYAYIRMSPTASLGTAGNSTGWTTNQSYYRFQVSTYGATWAIPSTATGNTSVQINGTTVAAASRGTPGGMWKFSPHIVAGTATRTGTTINTAQITGQTSGTNTMTYSYAYSSTWPPEFEPVWVNATNNAASSIVGQPIPGYVLMRVNSAASTNTPTPILYHTVVIHVTN
ncbi:MAG: hypothetical protein FWG89_01770 [Treponema sp.]|nr:hypothetical protein [Treponema sp.]